MYVYLKFGDVVKVVSNVTIDEDCCPIVDGKLILESPREGESAISKSTIDAIAWFKSLPMEAVYIDCGARDARWSPKSVTMEECTSGEISRVSVRLRKTPNNPATKEKEQDATLPVPFMPESTRPLFSEHPGVLDFNPVIDEMFERTEELLRRWDVLSQNGETNKEIAKILHCYVFPAVSFKQVDIPVLQECLRIIVLKQKAIEKDIVDTEKSIAVTENVLNQQKKILLANELMTTQSYLKACEADFVEMFYVHVTKDIQNKNPKLDVLQLKVNELKRSGQDAEKLRKYKKERDDLHETIQKLLTVREAIRNHLYRPFIRRKKKQKKVKISENEASLHTMFKEVHQSLVKDKDLLKRLCYRKLHAASVREAIESTVNMLKQNNSGTLSLGDFSEFSVYLGTKREDKQQWESMQVRVDGWMSSQSDLCRVHMEGCQLVQDLSAGMISDSRIASIGLDPSEIELLEIGEGGRQSAEDAGDAEGPEGEDVCVKRAPMVQVIKNQVLVHTWEMAEKIASQMDINASPVCRHINRAWVCYDPHFWKEAGKAVESVYTHYHAPQARRVHRRISSVALTDIIDGNIIQEFFHCASRDHHSAEDSSSESACARIQLSDTASVVSLDLQRCSMTDLYAQVNRDGARLNCQMLDLKSVTHSVNSLGSYSSSDSNDLSEVGPSKEGDSADILQVGQLQREDSSASDSGASVHSDDLFDTDGSISDKSPQERETIQSSQAVGASVLSFFDSIVEPYHAKVQEVLDAPSVMEKMQAVWQSVDFLSKKTGEVCKARGMDTLLPMSIFATASFSEEMFVKYYIQLLILTDLKPSFAFHSMYDFSLTSAFSTFMFLFEDRFPGRVQSDGSLNTV